jgi:hypothetical protein
MKRVQFNVALSDFPSRRCSIDLSPFFVSTESVCAPAGGGCTCSILNRGSLPRGIPVSIAVCKGPSGGKQHQLHEDRKEMKCLYQVRFAEKAKDQTEWFFAFTRTQGFTPVYKEIRKIQGSTNQSVGRLRDVMNTPAGDCQSISKLQMRCFYRKVLPQPTVPRLPSRLHLVKSRFHRETFSQRHATGRSEVQCSSNPTRNPRACYQHPSGSRSSLPYSGSNTQINI